MGFVIGLPRFLRGNNYIWVIVDQLTRYVHFLPMKVNFSLERLTYLYVKEIVRMHGVPVFIVFDRDPLSLSRFWHSLHKALGIKILKDLLRACVLDLKGNWDDHLPLMKFTYNNSFWASIGMTPFEGLYGRRCRSLVCWDDVRERKLLGPELVQLTVDSCHSRCTRNQQNL